MTGQTPVGKTTDMVRRSFLIVESFYKSLLAICACMYAKTGLNEGWMNLARYIMDALKSLSLFARCEKSILL
jgi:hypothetical protein